MHRTTPSLLAMLAAFFLLVGAGSAVAAERTTPELIAQARDSGRISSHAERLLLADAIARPGRLPARYRSDAPWDGTLPLLRLRRELRALPAGEERTELAAALDPATCDSSNGPVTHTEDTAHFHISYDTVGAGLTPADYFASLETAWTTEVDAFGWPEPPRNAPGGGYHVRIDSLGSGLYGYVSPVGDYAGLVGDNPHSAWDDGDAFATCMVLNDDYTGFPSPPQASLDSTTAHEFNHSIQFGIGALDGTNVPHEVFVEGGATWMEDEVFDSANDNYNYLWPDFTEGMREYDDPSPYPYWITFRGITERFGTGVAGGGEQVMQDFWEGISESPGTDDLDSMQAALAVRGLTLAQAFHDYAIAVKFDRPCGGGYVLPWCFEEGLGYIAAATPAGVPAPTGTIGAVGGSITRSAEDDYGLAWIALPASAAPYDVRLANTSSPAGGLLRGTVVCDTGSELVRMPLPAVVSAGGPSTAARFDPAACTSQVLVVTNEALTPDNQPNSRSRDRNFNVLTTAAQPTLSVARAGSGSGAVTSSPAGIDCGADCGQTYGLGTNVTLTAAAAAGSAFTGWSGACSGTALTCTVSMTGNRSVTATFDAVPAGGGEPQPQPEPSVGPGTALPQGDTLPPSLTRLALRSHAFRALVGTRLSFLLSEPATVRLTVQRCTRMRAGRCTRWSRVRGSRSLDGRAGANRVRFKGRIGGRTLRPGRYRLRAVARDSAGNAGTARRVGFRVVR